MALKLSDAALGTSPELWIGMQSQYDLWRASQHGRKKVETVVRRNRAPTPWQTASDVDRSDPCHCCSGKKYKKCWGGDPKLTPMFLMLRFSC